MRRGLDGMRGCRFLPARLPGPARARLPGANARSAPLRPLPDHTIGLLAQNLAGDDQALDFAGSLTYRAQLYVAVELLYRIVLDEAVAPVQLHRLIADLHRDFTGHQLGHG